MPLGGKTGKKLGVQIDIINTLSMSMVKIFSQLLLYRVMDDRYLSQVHFQLYMLYAVWLR